MLGVGVTQPTINTLNIPFSANRNLLLLYYFSLNFSCWLLGLLEWKKSERGAEGRQMKIYSENEKAELSFKTTQKLKSLKFSVYSLSSSSSSFWRSNIIFKKGFSLLFSSLFLRH
jgi:hypothetical protein